MELVATFLQRLHDCGDIYDDLESGARVEVGHELGQGVRQLEESGFIVYGSRTKRPIEIGGHADQIWTATVRVVRITNPMIWDPAAFKEMESRLEAQESDQGSNSV